MKIENINTDISVKMTPLGWVLAVLFVGAFLLKVYNEEQQTNLYRRSAVAAERTASILEHIYGLSQAK